MGYEFYLFDEQNPRKYLYYKDIFKILNTRITTIGS